MLFKLPWNFDQTPELGDGFAPIPPAEYLCEVVEADIRPTTKPGRSQIVLQLRVVDGDYTNRRLFDRRNLPKDEEGPEHFVAQRLRELVEAIPECYKADTGEIETDFMKDARIVVRTRNEKDTRSGHEDEMQSRITRMMHPDAVGGDGTDSQLEPEVAPAPQPPPSPPAKPAVTVRRPQFRKPAVARLTAKS